MEIKDFQHVVDAYIALLKVEGSIRYTSLFQGTLGALRNEISSETNQGTQETQEKYEEIALYEKENLNRYDCESLQKFFEKDGDQNGFSLYTGNNLTYAWARYKYKIYK